MNFFYNKTKEFHFFNTLYIKFIHHIFIFLFYTRVSQNISRSRFYFCKRNYFNWLILLYSLLLLFFSQDGSKILISKIVHWIRNNPNASNIYSKSQQHHLEKISFFSILQARSRLWFGFLMRRENFHRVCIHCTMLELLASYQRPFRSALD